MVLYKVNRVPTGIPNLDDLIEGGFPKNSIILLTGPPGSGKTIFALNYLYKGVSKYNEKGIFISLEMPVKDVCMQASQFGWDLKKMREKLNIYFIQSEYKITGANILGPILNAINRSDAKRVVLDSISSFIDFYLPQIIKSQPYLGQTGSGVAIRYAVSHIMEELKKIDATIILVSELSDTDSQRYSRDGVSEYLCDGIINLHFLGIGGEQYRNLEIPKMRLTKQENGYFPYDITKRGIKIEEKEKFKA